MTRRAAVADDLRDALPSADLVALAAAASVDARLLACVLLRHARAIERLAIAAEAGAKHSAHIASEVESIADILNDHF